MAKTKTEDTTTLVAPGEEKNHTVGFVSKGSREDLAKILGREGARLAPQMLTLAEGDIIHGYVKSEGTAQVEDRNTKRLKDVTCWVIELRDGATWSRGPDVSILGAAMLDRQVKPYLGCAVTIARGAETKHKGGNLTEYKVFVHEDLSRLTPDQLAKPGEHKITGPVA